MWWHKKLWLAAMLAIVVSSSTFANPENDQDLDSNLPGGDLPGGDLSGDDLPGDDLPGDDLPGGDLPGGDLPEGDLPENPISEEPDEDETITTDGPTDITTETPATTEPESDNINEDLTVVTNFGPVQGFQWQESENIIGYYDIPYGTFSYPFQVCNFDLVYHF